MDECLKHKGRLYDLCTGQGHDGRPNPTQDACDRFRGRHNNDRIKVKNPSSPTPKAIRNGDVAVSAIGTHMETLIRKRVAAVPCSRCRQRILMLNSHTPDSVASIRDALIKEMVADAAEVAPSWWAKMLVVSDQFLHLGGTQYLLNWCLDDAIAMERLSPLQPN